MLEEIRDRDREYPPSLEEYLRISNDAFRDLISAFFLHPYGFHGDSGIQQYLYHRLLTRAGNRAIWPPYTSQGSRAGCAYLLLRSERYTQLTYQNTKAKKPTPGRFDMAFIDPTSLPKIYDIPPEKEPKAMVAFEVGKNKGEEKMGDVNKTISEEGPMPGDAAKIIRGIDSRHLEAGYVLEFYDGMKKVGKNRKGHTLYTKIKDQESVARKIATQLKPYADRISENRLRIAFVLYHPSTEPTVGLYPKEWEQEMSLPYKKLLIEPTSIAEKETVSLKKQKTKARITFTEFCQRCSPCGLALQNELCKYFKNRCKLLYGGKTMTVNYNNRRLLRISNRYDDHGECISDMHPAVLESLQTNHTWVHDNSGYVRIPNEVDKRFNEAVIVGIESAISAVK